MAYFITSDQNIAILGAGITKQDALTDAQAFYPGLNTNDAQYMECTDNAFSANCGGVSDWTLFEKNDDGLLDCIIK